MTDKVLEEHVKNISSRNAPCAYFSDMLGEDREKRCLAVEQFPEKVLKRECQFYDPSRETKCNYPWNYEIFKEEETDETKKVRWGIDYFKEFDPDSVKTLRVMK